MRKRTDIEITASQVTLVERTPLPGIVGFSQDLPYRDEPAVLEVEVRGDAATALASVQKLSSAMGVTCKVHGMEVRPK